MLGPNNDVPTPQQLKTDTIRLITILLYTNNRIGLCFNYPQQRFTQYFQSLLGRDDNK